ncbi:MAG TPA: PAS domain S-box protein [Pyrinomonadaceae bacterium]|jgi:PAS domain S-box-containing protein|nr:PAS domain S-box protein [Pyrinomonadaceae bacterium]
MVRSNEDNRRRNHRRTEDIYRKSVEDIRDYAIFMTDPEGLVTNWNCGAEHILGYTEAEILGKNLSRFFTAEDRAKDVPQKELTTAALEGRAEDERWHVRRDGSRFWASGVVTVIRDDAGEIIGFTKVMRDMTERNRLTEDRDRFFTLSIDLLCVVHLDGRFQRVNPAFEKVLGFSEEEVLAMSLFELLHPEDLSATAGGYEKLSKGEPATFMQNRLRCKDGSYKWFAWSYFPVPEDDLAFGVGRDMTELKQMHDVLQLRAQELEESNRVKDEFLATLSHELRTPLTSILGWSKLLRSNQLSDADRNRAIQIIQRNAESQAKLIEDLLEVSRIITGKLRIEFQPVTFPAIVDIVISSLRPAIDAKRLQLETAIDPATGAIMGDPARLQQIVTNLLANAIKFTPEGGRIEILLQRVNAHARLEVRDTGVGIPLEDLPHIFERFKQVDSSNVRTHGGLGLGLAIVDYLVRQQAGVIFAESEGPGKGATFIVEFPLTHTELIISDLERVDLFSEHARTMLEEPETFADQMLKGLRILIVEDDADTRELLTTILERCGAKVRAVTSSNAALAEMAQGIPDVLISDIGMAGENGYDLIKKIRSLDQEQGGRVPAVALTAYATPADRRRALLAGFQTHLAKPVEPDELLAVIASLSTRNETA